VIVYNSNPVAVAPDSTRVARGFAREDLFTVVLEHFQTDTADYADILLPATTQLEHLDVIKPYGHYYMVANNPAIAPLGEAKPNTEIFRLLAKAMGFTTRASRFGRDHCAGGGGGGLGFRRRARRGLEAGGPTQGNGAICRRRIRHAVGQGRVLLGAAAGGGFGSLPDYIAPQEDTRSAAASRYPLAMISPPARNFLNSSFVNVQSLRAGKANPGSTFIRTTPPHAA
jgi:anaerobic selenocysteine-containing dehydrogenase